MTKIDFDNIKNNIPQYNLEASSLAVTIDKCFIGQPRCVCLSALELNIMRIIKLATQDVNYDSRNKLALHTWLDCFNDNILNIIEEV